MTPGKGQIKRGETGNSVPAEGNSKHDDDDSKEENNFHFLVPKRKARTTKKSVSLFISSDDEEGLSSSRDGSDDEDSKHNTLNTTSKIPTPTNASTHRTPASSSKKRKVPTHPATEPTADMKTYCTSHYAIYNSTKTQPPLAPSGKFKKFAQFDTFTLYINPHLTNIASIPKHGVRLDDMTIYFVLQAYFNKQIKKSDISRYWLADFDQQGMVRATRYPLGNPAKVYVPEGSEDGKGVKVAVGGWYYRWYGNIHVLCGEEGADDYLVRPSFEKLEKGFTFRVDWRCKVQAAVYGAGDGFTGGASEA